MLVVALALAANALAPVAAELRRVRRVAVFGRGATHGVLVAFARLAGELKCDLVTNEHATASGGVGTAEHCCSICAFYHSGFESDCWRNKPREKTLFHRTYHFKIVRLRKKKEKNHESAEISLS